MVCRAAHFDSEWYARWSAPIKAAQIADIFFPPKLFRKMWEWCAIAEVLHQRGLLSPGKRGIGFAVGKEPLPSLFAAHGASVLATDLDTSTSGDQWAKTGQQAVALEHLHWPKLIVEDEFRSRVRFKEVDMRDLSSLEEEKADFLWSSCSFEHLGTLDLGWRFVEEAMGLLAPGGLAVHTTEYNVRSNTSTLESGASVIYRRRDIEEFAFRLRAKGMTLEPPDFRSGKRLADLIPDLPPYYESRRQHVKLKIGDFVATSILLVISKPGGLPECDPSSSCCGPG
jgi:hypothetical protein